MAYRNKDAKLAIDANLPLSIEQIVNLSQEEYNHLVSIVHMSLYQKELSCKIRRRGRNKCSAHKSRQKKLNDIIELQSRVTEKQLRDLNLDMEIVTIQNKEEECMYILKGIIEQILLKHNADPEYYAVEYLDGRLHIKRKIYVMNTMDVYYHLKTKNVNVDYISFTP